MSDELRHHDSQVQTDEEPFRLICELFREKHGKLLESMPDGIIVINTSGRIVLANSHAEKLFGYERGDLVSLAIEALVPVELRAGHVSQRDSYIADPYPRAMGEGGELHGVRWDGSEFPAEISLSPMQPDDGLLVCAAVRDVSKRLSIEKALRESEEKLRAQVLEERYFDLYVNSPDMCASIDAVTRRIVNCNNTLAEATGYTREELLAMPHISYLYAPECEDARVDVFREFVETGMVRDEELQLKRSDGGIIDVSLSLTAVRGENRNVVRSRSVWRDITSRRRSEKMLRLVVEGTSLSFGEDYFRLLTRHLANALDVRCAFVSEIPDQRGGQLRLLAFWNGNGFEQNFEYDVQGTPCEHVMEQGLVYYPDSMRQLFPEDEWLKGSDIESYLAVALLDLDGNSVGVMGIANAEPISFPSDARSILQVSSMRASAELLRMRTEQALLRVHDELELRVQDRTADLEGANAQLEREAGDRMLIEDALRASEEQIRLILDSTVEAIYGLDFQGNCTFCNRACVETLGYDHADDLLGQNMHDLMHHTRNDGSHYRLRGRRRRTSGDNRRISAIAALLSRSWSVLRRHREPHRQSLRSILSLPECHRCSTVRPA